MNASKPYAVSVQWGRGWHYFEGYYDTSEEANKIAEHTLKRLEKQAKRKTAAQPHVLVWQLQRVLPPIPPEK